MSSANFLTHILAPDAPKQSPMKVPSMTNLALLYWPNMTWGDQLISCPTAMEVPELERRPYLDSESFRQTIADVPSFCLQAEMPINEKQQKFLFSPSFLSFPLFSVLCKFRSLGLLPSFFLIDARYQIVRFLGPFLVPGQKLLFSDPRNKKKIKKFYWWQRLLTRGRAHTSRSRARGFESYWLLSFFYLSFSK